MNYYDKYEVIVGLEVHAQLMTKSKAFSSDVNEYGSNPNVNVSVISLGHPGTLPRMNKDQVRLAVKLGLAMNCSIRYENRFARKNYFYADLPKGYQITQFDTPICYDGHITIKDEAGNDKIVHIERIHMEEDAGKSMHDQDPYDSLIDLNRAGTPLVEIVTKPDIKSSKEAANYLTEVRKLLRYLDVCDGNMEEGSMRCDANISVRLKGSDKLNTRAEVKNMNSIRNVQRAIEFEFERQCELMENGGTVVQETRGFDAVSGKTSSMRSKEMAHDYRYFPEPDLPPVILDENYIKSVKNSIPELPHQLFDKYKNQFKLSGQDAYLLSDNKETAQYFEQILQFTSNYKSAANWMMGPIKSYLNENGIEISSFQVPPSKIAELIHLVDTGKISHTAAVQSIFKEMTTGNTKTAEEIAAALNLIQESNVDLLEAYVESALAKFPDKVSEYKSGKVGLLGLFVGEVMKLSGGKADPKLSSELVRKKLNE